MGRRERQSLKSNLIVVLLHLLKWQFQPKRRSVSWEGSIVEHRRRIRDAIEDSLSLKPYLETIFDRSYKDAVKQAKAETGLPLETFREECPYELAEVVNDDFLPEQLFTRFLKPLLAAECELTCELPLLKSESCW
jgi:hypothetical protein